MVRTPTVVMIADVREDTRHLRGALLTGRSQDRAREVIRM